MAGAHLHGIGPEGVQTLALVNLPTIQGFHGQTVDVGGLGRLFLGPLGPLEVDIRPGMAAMASSGR